MTEHRVEKDSLGEVRVPAEAMWGAQTQRAVENFPVSGQGIPRGMIRAFGRIKRAYALENRARGALAPDLAEAVARAATEVLEGLWDDHFPVDVFQTGSGTSSNMNANEVIANRAIEILGGARGSKTPVHPNDHVNMGQSSNDVVPSAIHLAAAEAVTTNLLPALEGLARALADKAEAFDPIVKIGRTHLMDAVPVRLGQEFSGYAQQVRNAARRVEAALPSVCELALGGTAVGTGLNAPPGLAGAVILRLAEETGLPLRQAPNLFEALAARDALVALSGALRAAAVGLTKVAEDVRWLGSGPRCGLGEIRLPDLQPGSSIMPGKVNPVMAEMLVMVCAQVFGNDQVVAYSGARGQFELNAMLPVMARNLLESVAILSRGAEAFTKRCVDGLEADEARCAEMVERSLAMVTALAPVIGYDLAAELAKEAHATGRTVREICMERKVLPAHVLDDLLDARKMTG
ncbi:MAG: class II fumarate hydratase [Acidobacteriota bacterium]